MSTLPPDPNPGGLEPDEPSDPPAFAPPVDAPTEIHPAADPPLPDAAGGSVVLGDPSHAHPESDPDGPGPLEGGPSESHEPVEVESPIPPVPGADWTRPEDSGPSAAEPEAAQDDWLAPPPPVDTAPGDTVEPPEAFESVLADTSDPPAVDALDAPSASDGGVEPAPAAPDPVVAAPDPVVATPSAFTPPGTPESAGPAAQAAELLERPEVRVGLAFVGGAFLSFVLKRFGR